LSQLSGKERIIIPLDVPNFGTGKDLVDRLTGRVGAFKIGREAIDGRYGHRLGRVRNSKRRTGFLGL